MIRARFLTLLLAIVTLGVGSVTWATHQGIGVTPDSTKYLDGAAGLASGHGYVEAGEGGSLVPSTHFPPLYSATLVPLIVAGLSPQAAARLLALILLAANVIFAAYVTHRYTRSRGATLLVAAIMAMSPQLLLVHTAAWSEQLFILLAGVSLLTLSLHLEERERDWRPLVMAAIAAALACLCRFAGIALIATGALAVLLLGSKPWWQRLVKASAFAVVAAVPTAAWMVRNVMVSAAVTDRAVQPDTLSFAHLQGLAATVASWWLPAVDRIHLVPGQDALTAAATACVIGFLVYGALRWVAPTIKGRRELVQTPILFLLFAGVHILMVLVLIALWDRTLILDTRILAPAFVAFVFPCAYILQRGVIAEDNRLLRNAALVLGNGIAVLAVIAGLALSHYFHREGRGYNAPRWHYPAIEQALSGVDPRTPILSNQVYAVRFLMGRVPRVAEPWILEDALRSHGEAIIIYFDEPRVLAPRHDVNVRLPPDTAERRLTLLRHGTPTLLARERNAWIYRMRPPG